MFALLRSAAAGPVRRSPPAAVLIRSAATTSSLTPVSSSSSSDEPVDLAAPSSSSSPSSSSASSSLQPTTTTTTTTTRSQAPSQIPEEFLDPSTGLMLPPALLPKQPLPAALLRQRPERIARDVKEPVDHDHPLWAFFRNKTTTIQRLSKKDASLTRPFEASELRLKSFDELHTLWFMLLREKNIYYTQMAEAARRGVHPRMIKKLGTQVHRQKIQTAMARIKYVLSERSQGYAAIEAEVLSDLELRERLKLEEDEATLAGAGGSAAVDGHPGLEADVLAGRQLPEPKQVREFREKLRLETGRHGRIGNERRARLPKRGDGEEAFGHRGSAAKRKLRAQQQQQQISEE